jgi:hypothetical protein
MKKIFFALTLVAFMGGTSFATTALDGDPVKTEKTKGDEKKKKKKKKKKKAKTSCTKSTEKSCCSKSANKSCSKKKEL